MWKSVCLPNKTYCLHQAASKILIRVFRTVKDTSDVSKHLVQYREIRYRAGRRTQAWTENEEGGGLQSSNKGRMGLVLQYCFLWLKNYRLVFCFFLLNLSFTQAWGLFESRIYTYCATDGKFVHRMVTLLGWEGKVRCYPVQEHTGGDRFKTSRLFRGHGGGLRHRWSTPAPAIKAAGSRGLAPAPQPRGEFQEWTLPCGQPGSPALLNPAVYFPNLSSES